MNNNLYIATAIVATVYVVHEVAMHGLHVAQWCGMW